LFQSQGLFQKKKVNQSYERGEILMIQ